MDLGVILYAAMAVPMLLLIGVHYLCHRVTGQFPGIMPDDMQRSRYRQSEFAMGMACVSMLWYGWELLPWMISICAVDPWAGIYSHGPWIAATWLVLVLKTRHLMRLVGQTRT